MKITFNETTITIEEETSLYYPLFAIEENIYGKRRIMFHRKGFDEILEKIKEMGYEPLKNKDLPMEAAKRTIEKEIERLDKILKGEITVFLSDEGRKRYAKEKELLEKALEEMEVKEV